MNSVLAQAREESHVLTFALNAQDHHHVRALDRVFDFSPTLTPFPRKLANSGGTSVPGPRPHLTRRAS